MRFDFNLVKRIVDKIAIIFSFLESGSDYHVVIERKEKNNSADNSSSIDGSNGID